MQKKIWTRRNGVEGLLFTKEILLYYKLYKRYSVYLSY